MSDVDRINSTLSQFEAGLRDSLDTPSRIRGWVSDQLFGLISADLGGCQLVKQEDAGVLFHESEVKLPDWRLALSSGESILVEVKSVDDATPRDARLRRSEVARLKRYVELDGTPLYVAVHWVALSLWTLVPLEDFAHVGEHFEIPLEIAFKRDHMGSLLKDRMLGLIPPLICKMTLEEGEEESSPPPAGTTKADSSQVSLVVRRVQLFGGGQEMVDDQEKALVWFLIRHASWPVEEVLDDVGDGTWEVVFTMAPEDVPAGQGFAVVGRLSELYTRMFASSTTPLDGEGTTQLTVDVEPGTLPRLVPTDLRSDRLPLWHLTLQPAESTSRTAQ